MSNRKAPISYTTLSVDISNFNFTAIILSWSSLSDIQYQGILLKKTPLPRPQTQHSHPLMLSKRPNHLHHHPQQFRRLFHDLTCSPQPFRQLSHIQILLPQSSLWWHRNHIHSSHNTGTFCTGNLVSARFVIFVKRKGTVHLRFYRGLEESERIVLVIS
jgi:hypothetical protein